MEVSELADATNTGDMGVLDAHTFHALCRPGRNCFITMARCEQFSWGDAKVRSFNFPRTRLAGKYIFKNAN